MSTEQEFKPKQFSEVLKVIPHNAGSWPAVGGLPGEDYKLPKNPNKPARKVKFITTVSSYCQVNEAKGYRSLAVQPAPWVLDHLKRHMIAIENDSISFTLRQNAPGEDYTLRAQYNLIIGSRLIAIIAANSVPQEA